MIYSVSKPLSTTTRACDDVLFYEVMPGFESLLKLLLRNNSSLMGRKGSKDIAAQLLCLYKVSLRLLFTLIMSTSIFHSNEYSRTPLQDSGPSRGVNLTGSSSQEGPEASGDEKDDEIARLKRAYHDAVMENKNNKVSAKTNM